MTNDILLTFLRRYPLLGEGPGWRPALAGFSGGVDSTALLLLLQAAQVPVTAVHFHHGLRGADADADASWCEAFCAVRGIPFLCRRLAVPRHRLRGESVETAARRLRLAGWAELSRERGGCPVFLAHHADDALEELLLRLMRGSNATGLTSLRPVRRLGGLTFLRPLLSCRKSELQRYVESCGVRDWCVDATNGENDCRRNAIRNRLLPLMREIAGTDEGLLQALEALRLDADCLESGVERLFGSRRWTWDGVEARPRVFPGLDAWRELARAQLPRMFRLWRQREGGGDVVPSGSFVRRLHEALHAEPFAEGVLQVDGAARVRVSAHGLELLRDEPAPEPFEVEWRWREQPSLTLPGRGRLCCEPSAAAGERFACGALPERLTVRSWRPGDRMRPFGRTGSKKLQDLFVDGHVPVGERHRLPLVCAGEEIIWAPGVRRAEFGRVAEGEEAVWLRFEPW
ncbi:MAG: tRNA lysidine(34) synthetase TilS [Oligosphaeraceae bacterium]